MNQIGSVSNLLDPNENPNGPTHVMANTKPKSAAERSFEMTDLVERLRRGETVEQSFGDLVKVIETQADRIEALEKEVEREHGINRPLVSELETFRSQLAEKDKEIERLKLELDAALAIDIHAIYAERDALVKALTAILDAEEDGDSIAIRSIARAALGGEE